MKSHPPPVGPLHPSYFILHSCACIFGRPMLELTFMRISKLFSALVAFTMAFTLGAQAQDTAAPKGKVKVVMETSKGTIELELDADKAPITVKNFVSYAKKGFYEGTVFHRIIPGFMAQG